MIIGAQKYGDSKQSAGEEMSPFVVALNSIITKIANFGLGPELQGTERKYAESTNVFIAVLTLSMTLNIFITAALRIYAICALQLILINFFGVCLILIYKKRYLISRIFGILVQNLVVFCIAILAGSKSGAADFLLLSCIVTVIVLDFKYKRLVALCSIQPFVLYVIYMSFAHEFDAFSIPMYQQNYLFWTFLAYKFLFVSIIVIMVLKTHVDRENEHIMRNKVLKQQRNHYYHILDSLPIGIATFDSDFRYNFVNKISVKDKEMNKWLIGKTDEQYAAYKGVDNGSVSKRKVLLNEAIANNGLAEIEEDLTNKEGKRFSSIKGAVPLYDVQTGELSEIVCYAIDITKRRDAEDQLRETVKQLESMNTQLKQFGYVVSHDLKTPLRNISTYTQLLQRRNKLDDESNELVADVVRSVKHMHQMINDIFLYASSDQTANNKEEVSISGFVEQICTDMKGVLAERNADVRIQNNMPDTYINATHIQHLYHNLITNAIKYNKSQNPIVDIGWDSNTGEYYVRDNGIGIDPRFHAQIFDLFKRLHTTQEYEGTGVGLSLCKKIVEIYGGSLRLESQEGAGSAFYFTLPSLSSVAA